MPPRFSLNTVAFAQNAEDVVLLRAFAAAGIDAGFYVDAGAGHPTHGSLTWNLVHKKGWLGIDIEPQLELYEALRIDRPNNTVLQCALGELSGEREFHQLPGNWGMSTLDDDVAERHRTSGYDIETSTVAVRTLNEVLLEAVSRDIDLLKIDVEGYEKEVLAGANLECWRPGVLVIEATAPASNIRTHLQWEYLVLSYGYELCLFDGLNRFYVRADHPKVEVLRHELAVPANVFDRYVPAYWWGQLSVATRDELDPEGLLPRPA